METIQICWTEKPLSKYGLRWGIQYFLINMKLFLISFLFICTTHALFAQESLSSMPKGKRDSVLVEVTQKLLKDKFPKWYRKDVYPSITQSDFKYSFLKWLQKEWPKSHKSIPEYLKPEDLCYNVTLYYEKWRDEKFEVPFTAMVYIIEKTQEPYKIRLGTKYCEYHSLIKLDEK